MHSIPQRLWQITELAFEPRRQHHYETLFTIGNGYLGTRGSFEEGFENDTPSTLVHGIYDHTPGALVPELVNAPNWLELNITVDGTPFKVIQESSDSMRPPHGLAIGYKRVLYLDTAVLRREVLFRAASGNIARLVFERFASLHDHHVMVQTLTVTAVEGQPEITVEAVLDGDVTNNGARHWRDDMDIRAEANEIALGAVTAESGYSIGLASRLITPHTATATAASNRATSKISFKLGEEESQTLYKITAIYTSREDENPLQAAQRKLNDAANTGYDEIFRLHKDAWAQYWHTADVRIDGDEDCQRAVRFTTYHFSIAAPRHSDRVSIGAKTLSGLGYKGHVFWDTELFIVPPLVLIQPELGRNLLMYRYHNLQGARNKAQANGYEGAMYPWESTDTGEETTPQWGDPQPDGTRIRIWTGDNEQHISTDITYAIMKYWEWSGDDDFMRQYGAEMILDTAVFWGSRVEHNGELDRYEISQQIGPDEYHENIDNSVFVNRMVVWHLDTARQLLGWLQSNAPADHDRLAAALKLSPERLSKWDDVIAKMFIPFDAEKAIHVQFPGFFEMEYIPVQKYQPRTMSVQSILGHYRSIQTQVIKQADVVMMMALLGENVGAPQGFDVREVMLNNWNTYYPRCDQGSSLSPAMHAWVASRLNLPDEAYEMFYHAAHIDLQDNKGNVGDGMHAAACGGVWQALIFGFCGLHIDANSQLATDPRLPAHWREVSFNVYYRGEVRNLQVRNPAMGN